MNNLSEKMLAVSHEVDVDITSGTTTEQVYVRVYNSIFTSGIVSAIGTSGLTTLIALASFMDENGECYPTQQQIADRIGCHKNTANKYVNDLLSVRIDGKPLVTRTKVNKGKGLIYSYYKIHPLSQLSKFNGKIEHVKITDPNDLETESTITDPCDNKVTDGCDTLITNGCDEIRITNNNNQVNNIKDSKESSEKPFNSRDAIALFLETYREVYHTNYVIPNYAMAAKILKDKVVTPYPDMAREIIELGVREYDQRFRNKKFPRPTINMFSWASSQLVEAVEEKRKREVIANQAPEAEAEAETAMLAKLGKLG